MNKRTLTTTAVIENQMFEVSGQAFDGFSIVVDELDLEFAGKYNFTHSYTLMEARELISSGDALNDEDGDINT